MGGTLIWGLGMGLTTQRRKLYVTKCFKVPRIWTDSLARPKQWKRKRDLELEIKLTLGRQGELDSHGSG
jgi:hypothetical protein